MKKILTVSVLAMMAVTAANAQIASKAYVDSGAGNYISASNTAGQNIKALDTQLKANTDKLPSSGTVADAIAAALEDADVSTALQDVATATGDVNGVVSAVGKDGTDVTVTKALVAKSNLANALVTEIEGKANTADLGALASLDEVAESNLASALATKINGKQDALGYTAENAANKVTSMTASSSDTEYPSAKAVYDAVEAAKTAASTAISDMETGTHAAATYQPKSTEASIGGANGSWTALSSDQLAALNSGATTTNIGKIATNESAIATLNGNDQTTGSVAKTVKDAIDGLNSGGTYEITANKVATSGAVAASTGNDADTKYPTAGGAKAIADAAVAGAASNYDAAGSAAAAETAAKSYADGLASNYDAAGSATAAETAAKGYTDTAIANMQVTTNLSSSIATDTGDTTKYPSVKAVEDAIAAAGTTAGNTYQAKSTANYQMGKSDGTWETMSQGQQDALNSGVDATKVGTYDSVSSAVNNATTGLAATKTIADNAAAAAAAAIPAPSGNCTDCVLHYNGSEYSWEEIARASGE